MNQKADATCPECGTKANVKLEDENGLSDSVVKVESQDVVIEISCKEPDCSKVWRAVYSFAGNQ